MNLREVVKHCKANILSGNAVVLKGPPGFGKTDLTAKLAMWWKQQHPGKRVGVSVFFMATQTPIGFTGLPWRGTREFGDGKQWTVTDPAIPQWYMATDLETGEVRPASMFDSVFLIIEEWGQGSAEAKRAGAEVLRAGGTPPYYLPPGSPRIALTNIDARDGVTKEFDFIIGRRWEAEVTGDVDVWIEDFADRPYQWQGRTWEVSPITKFWAKRHPDIVFEPKPEKQGPWCNPRTLTSADRYVQTITDMNGGVTPVDDEGFVQSMAGHIGMAGTVSYVSELRFRIDLPQYEEVIAAPMSTPIPSKADLQLLMAYELGGRCKKEHLAEVIQYMSRKEMPKDMSVSFISTLLRRDYKAMVGEPAMQAWIAGNAQLVSVIGTLANN